MGRNGQPVPPSPAPRISTDSLPTGGTTPLQVLHLQAATPSPRPAILIVAGIDPRHTHIADVAKAVVEKLIKEHAAALDRADIYIIPQFNPHALMPAGPDTSRNPAAPGAIDADRDGRFNEDPPLDLDGDGQILQMRIKNPPPGLGLRAEYMAEADPRLLRRADAGKSERPLYALLTESKDTDGDGRLGEDGLEGIELDRNFPYHWPEFHDDAGRTPLSEAAPRALADWLLQHPEVVAVVTYTTADNLVNVPPGGKMDETGGAPATNHITDEDHAAWERIGTAFKDITHQKEAPTRDNEGTLRGWAYAQLGVWSFSTPVWVRPDQCPGAVPAPPEPAKAEPSKAEPAKPEPAKPEADKAADAAKLDASKAEPPKPEEKPKVPEGPPKIDSDDGKWLAYSDSLVAAGKPGGFIPWRAFKHPQLGEVEIGGWKPGFRQTIPSEDVARLAAEQAKFIANLADRLPRLTINGPRIERLAPNIWRISVEAVNDGELPTRTNMGVRVRRLPPTRWSIDLDPKRLISGERTARADTIPGGGMLSASWTITAAENDTIKLSLLSPECGDRTLEVHLTAPEAKP